MLHEIKHQYIFDRKINICCMSLSMEDAMYHRTLIAMSTVIPTLIIAASLCISRKERPVSNRLLGALFLVIALLTVSTIILSNYSYMTYFPVAHLLNLTIMLLGPLFICMSEATLSAISSLNLCIYCCFFLL